jgi:Secretion system C-terminal sorting domain/Kelch motif
LLINLQNKIMKRTITFFFFGMLMLGFQTGFGQWHEINSNITASFLNSSVAYDGKVYFTGGPQTQFVTTTIYNKNVQVLDLATETVSTAGELSVGRCAMAAVAYDGKVYFMGGHRWTSSSNAGIVTYDRVDIYDIQDSTWTLKHLSLSRTYGAAAVVGGKIIFAGGWHATSTTVEPSDVVDIYDPATEQWLTVKHLSVPRGELLEIGVVGNKAYICGGGTDWADYSCTNVVDVYDADLDTITTTEMPLSLPRMYANVVGVDKYLICAGGYTQTAGKTNRIDILDTETGLWSTSVLSAPRVGMAAAVLGKKAYFTGGGNFDTSIGYIDESSNIVDIFDAETGLWSTSNLTKNRVSHACAAWGNKIAVGGGWRAEQTQTTGSIEIFTDSTISAINDIAPKLNITIFPNPTSHEITIQFPDNFNLTDSPKMTLFDLTGRACFEAEIRGISERFDIGALPPGMYLLEVQGRAGRYVEKVAVQ